MAKEQMPASGSLYSRLGIHSTATDEQVRAAYYRLAKDFHPDGQKDRERDEEAFNSIVRAATILRDPAKRKLYDRGALNEDGGLAGPRGAWLRRSYRERALACFIAVVTVLASGVTYYSLESRRPSSPEGAHTGYQEENPDAGPVSYGVPFVRAAPEGKQPGFAPPIDDSLAELVKVLQGQQPVASPAPAAIPSHQVEPVSAVIAAAAADSRDQGTIVSRKPLATKQKSKNSPSSGNIIPSYRKEIPQIRNGCALTSAARDILAGIISR
jgi:hypothetical protein